MRAKGAEPAVRAMGPMSPISFVGFCHHLLNDDAGQCHTDECQHGGGHDLEGVPQGEVAQGRADEDGCAEAECQGIDGADGAFHADEKHPAADAGEDRQSGWGRLECFGLTASQARPPR